MIYFDTASTSFYKPEIVKQAVLNAMNEFASYGRGAHPAAMAASRAVFIARAALADFFGAKANQIVFTHNATESLNMAIFGLLNNETDAHVITTVLEHNSVLRPLYHLEQRGLLKLDFVGLDSSGNLDYSAFKKLLRKNTKCIVVTHCSNLTGLLVDINRIASFCKENNLALIVDAAQSAGLFPISTTKLGRAVLCFTGHKGLMGPQGTGGLVVNEITLTPLVMGGSGSNSFSKSHPDSMPEALEAGTLNSHGIAGLAAGVGYIKEIGIENILNYSQNLAETFKDGISHLKNIHILGNNNLTLAPIVSFTIGNLDSSQIELTLAQNGICARGGFHCAPLAHQIYGTSKKGAIRFSFSSFNTLDQVNIAIKVISKIEKEVI